MRKYRLQPKRARQAFRVDYERELNPQQLEAVMASGGPMLVLAGAGTGKTRTITYRVARLVESGVSASRILLVTFTRKAAREMLHRVEALTGKATKYIWGGTFHHIGNLVLRMHGPMIGIEKDYSIIDREDAKDLLDDCVRELGIDIKARRFPTGAILEDIASLSADTCISIAKTVISRYPFYTNLIPEIENIIKRYKSRKAKLSLLDFGDLLVQWKQLLEVKPEARERYQQKFLHILVDEYQDTNKIQAQIIDLLAAENRNLMVVGDDAQSIYSFRGADFGNIINFPKRYPDAKCYRLEINYRSTPQIIVLTNYSIAHNEHQFRKTLVSVKNQGISPCLVALEDVLEQASFIAQRILELRDEGIDLSEMAVLYRSHYHSMELQMELTRRGIPFVVRSGLRFFERAHIKDVVSYLKVLVNPFDELAWKRILMLIPGIGRITADKVWQKISTQKTPLTALKHKDTRRIVMSSGKKGFDEFVLAIEKLIKYDLAHRPAEAVHLVLTQAYQDYLQGRYPDYLDRKEDIKQLGDFATQYNSIAKFVSELALLGTVESEVVVSGSREEERLVLSSVHQAKGLEWTVVFVVWLCEGRFPVAKAMNSQEQIEEERRLFYVACTRAKDQLYLCYPLMSEGYTGAYIMKPSRFIRELNPETYEKWEIEH